MLSELDINTHSTFQVLRWLQETRGFDLAGKNVLAGGSHDFLEMNGFFHYGAKDIMAIECNPYVIPDLFERCNTAPSDKICYPIQACLWSETGIEKEFKFFKNQKYGAGSLFGDSKLSQYVPECKELAETIKLTTISFNDLIEEFPFTFDLYNLGWCSIDLQGSELEFLKGASKLMEARPEVFYTEVSWEEAYLGQPLLPEIDAFFDEHDYIRCGLRQDTIFQGDAIYVRK
jgi:FkbM family methyltransferase